MRITFNRTLLIIGAILFINPLFAGGGWPQPKGKGYFKISQSFIRAQYLFGPDGSTTRIPTFGYYSTNFYGEYGLSNRLTGIVDLPLFVRVTQNEVMRRQSGIIEPGDELNSIIGDGRLGLKLGLTRDKWLAASLSLIAGLPFGDSSGGESGILQTGDGEFNQMVMLDLSHSFYPKNIYTTVSIGFNNRTKGFSEEFRYGAEIGYTGFNNFLVALKVVGVESFFNGNAQEVNGIYSNNTEYLSVTPEINYFIKENMGISLSAGFAPYAKNILAAPNISGGLFLTL